MKINKNLLLGNSNIVKNVNENLCV